MFANKDRVAVDHFVFYLKKRPLQHGPNAITLGEVHNVIYDQTVHCHVWGNSMRHGLGAEYHDNRYAKVIQQLRELQDMIAAEPQVLGWPCWKET